MNPSFVLWLGLTVGWDGSTEISASPTLYVESGEYEHLTTVEPCVVSYDLKEVAVESKIELFILRKDL